MGRAGPSGSARPSPGSPRAARGSRRARSRSSATGRSPSPSSTGRRPSPRTRTCSSVSMPNSRTLSALVDTATKCFATAASSCEPRQQPVPGRPGVGQRLEGRERLAADDEQRLGGVEVHRGRRGCRRRRRWTRTGTRRARSEYWRRASVAIAGPRSEPPMPMLITLRIGLPGEPGPLAVADAHREGGHPVEHRVDVGDDVLAVDDQPLARGRAQGRVQDRPILGRVDALAREHRRPPLLDAVRPRATVQQELDRVGGRPMLRVVEEDARALGHHPARPVRVRGEQVAQVDVPQHRVVEREGLPLGGLVDRRLVGAHGLEAYARAIDRSACDRADERPTARGSAARRTDATRITLSGASGPRIARVGWLSVPWPDRDEIPRRLRGNHANRRRPASVS